MSVSLRSISDRDILFRTHELVARERKLTLAVLLHLNEIERRGLHLKLAYRSMFDYCTQCLRYSASAASRRIRTARCIARFPAVYTLLVSNEVNLSTISQASKILTPANSTEVLNRIRGKSQKEVAALVAEYEPRAALPPDRVRTVVLMAKPDQSQTRDRRNGSTSPTGVREEEKRGHSGDNATSAVDASIPADKKYDRCGCNSDTMAAAASTVKLERRALIQFSASEEFMAKLEQVRSIAWHRLPANASFEQVLEIALDLFIEKEDPSRRSERRKQRAEGKDAAVSKDDSKAHGRPKTATPNGRYIPARIRDEIYERDHGQCTFVGTNGKRCASRSALQIDHINPVARGGASTEDNLRLLCAYHNRSEAERLLGRWDKPAPQASAIEPG
jgi:5-methylcytosine-specific restriction endonuclease McrA